MSTPEHQDHSGTETERTPFMIQLGDVFRLESDTAHPLRVIQDVRSPGDITVSTAVPVMDSRRGEYFIVLGSTHTVADIGSTVDHWDLDRMVSAYRAGVGIQYPGIPGDQVDHLVTVYEQTLLSRVAARLVTESEQQEAIQYLEKIRNPMHRLFHRKTGAL